MTPFFQRVYQAVKRIPKGKVVTYGQVAVAAGRPLAARSVGSALHQNPYKSVPCHRVVNFQGRLALNFGQGGFQGQKERLLKEGVSFKTETLVDLKKHQVKRL